MSEAKAKINKKWIIIGILAVLVVVAIIVVYTSVIAPVQQKNKFIKTGGNTYQIANTIG